MGRKAAHKRNAAAEKDVPAKNEEDGQEKHKGSTKGERGSKQKERRQQKGNDEYGAWEQLTDLGLKIRSMASDGNCLFRSVGDQIAGDQKLHKELRQKTMDYVEAHEEDFAPFVEDDVKFPNYVKKMRKDGIWAGNIELQAMSMALKRNICIHRFMSPVWLIKNFDDPKVPTIHLSYHSNEHYNSVRNIDDNGLGPPSEIGISEAPASGGGSTRSGPKGSKGAKGSKGVKGAKGEDAADVKAVMRGAGCTDSERAAEVLKEFRGDVEGAIEFLVADMASSAEEEQAGAVEAQASLRESGTSTEGSAGNDEGCTGEGGQGTGAVEGPGGGGAEGDEVDLEGQGGASLNGADACAESGGAEPVAAMPASDGAGAARAPLEERGLSASVALEGGENRVQAACQAHGMAGEGAEERAGNGSVEKGVAEGYATDVGVMEGLQKEKGSMGGSSEHDAVRMDRVAEGGEAEVSGTEAPDEALVSPAPPLPLPCSPRNAHEGNHSPDAHKADPSSDAHETDPSSGAHGTDPAAAVDQANHSSDAHAADPSSDGHAADPSSDAHAADPTSDADKTGPPSSASRATGRRKGAAGKGVREGAMPRKQHPNKQKNGKAPGRNQQCPCGSRKKYKSCCGTRSGSSAPTQRAAEPRHDEDRRTSTAPLQTLYI